MAMWSERSWRWFFLRWLLFFAIWAGFCFVPPWQQHLDKETFTEMVLLPPLAALPFGAALFAYRKRKSR